MPKTSGMAGAATPFDAGGVTAQANLGADGRLLIPAAIRDAAGIERGDKVTMRVEDGRIVITGARAQWMRIQGLFADLKRPGESVVDDLIAERRAEAAGETEG